MNAVAAAPAVPSARRIRVSFEFFPPKTDGDGAHAVGGDRAARAARAQFRLGDLWRRRLDARAHPRDRRAHPAGDSADAGRASDLRRRDRAARSTTSSARYRDAGVRHIVALRGDPTGRRRRRATRRIRTAIATLGRSGRRHQSASPISRSRSRPIPRSIRRAATVEADIDMLKAKVDAGATRAITQFFFDNDLYFRYLDRVRARGIDIPIVPGIMPVQNFKQTANFAARAAPRVPDWLARPLRGARRRRRRRASWSPPPSPPSRCSSWSTRGVDDFHFYTMNRADLVFAICHLLGMRPQARTEGRLIDDPIAVPTPANRPARGAPRERILVLDGAMGTMIQALKLDEAGFRGARFADWHRDVQGNNDLLILTQPDAIEDIHARLSPRRRRHRRDQHVLLDLDRAGRLRHARPRLRAQPRGRAAGARRRPTRVAARGRPAALRRRRARADQPHRLDLARRRPIPASAPSPSTICARPMASRSRGLLDGGADLLLIETIFDTLNAKAAICRDRGGLRRDAASTCR